MIESIVFCKEIFIPKFVVEVPKELLVESLDLNLELTQRLQKYLIQSRFTNISSYFLVFNTDIRYKQARE